jgi:protein SCO1/2
MSHRLLSSFALVACAAGLSLAAAACSSSAPTKTTAPDSILRVEPPVPITDFELTDQHGDAYRLSEGDGALRLFYFGYTSCPDICPATMVDWRDARRTLGERAEAVRFLMVTVDPPNDTPEVLGTYLAHFDPTFIGLSGAEADLRRAWDAFGIAVRHVELPESATTHSISHSASIFVVDDEEKLVMKLAFDATSDDIVHGILQLLEEEQ